MSDSDTRTAVPIRLLLASGLSLCLAGTAAALPPAQPRGYWDVWVDGDGGTHQTRCRFTEFKPFSLGKSVEPIDVDKLPGTPAAIWIAQFPKGWVGNWHENPKPQWTIPLSGRWFVETTDGRRVTMGPGDASFGGDQGSRPTPSGHTGHLSGTVGDEPITLMFVQVKPEATGGVACRFH